MISLYATGHSTTTASWQIYIMYTFFLPEPLIDGSKVGSVTTNQIHFSLKDSTFSIPSFFKKQSILAPSWVGAGAAAEGPKITEVGMPPFPDTVTEKTENSTDLLRSPLLTAPRRANPFVVSFTDPTWPRP